VDIRRAAPQRGASRVAYARGSPKKRNGPALRRGEMGNRPANDMESAGRRGKDEDADSLF
jgi:hypothetical protein